jgi:transaldolase
MMKVPATPAGIDALESLAAEGITLNVTLIFTQKQYRAARNAIWRGAEKLSGFGKFKSVYSIFVSRVDVYTEQHVPTLSPAAQGMVGIVGAKRIWSEDQEIVCASTGTKKPSDVPWKYAAAFAGSDIETNPPATNDAIEASGVTFHREIDQMPPADVLAEIDAKVNVDHLEETLMSEGIKKFAEPQMALLKLIASKRAALAGSR